jgi:hypothetical protein
MFAKGNEFRLYLHVMPSALLADCSKYLHIFRCKGHKLWTTKAVDGNKSLDIEKKGAKL